MSTASHSGAGRPRAGDAGEVENQHFPSPSTARRRVLHEFREVTRLSSVGWSREVVAVDVQRAQARN